MYRMSKDLRHMPAREAYKTNVPFGKRRSGRITCHPCAEE